MVSSKEMNSFLVRYCFLFFKTFFLKEGSYLNQFFLLVIINDWFGLFLLWSRHLLMIKIPNWKTWNWENQKSSLYKSVKIDSSFEKSQKVVDLWKSLNTHWKAPSFVKTSFLYTSSHLKEEEIDLKSLLHLLTSSKESA